MTQSSPDNRSLLIAVWIITVLAILSALYFARTLLIPVTLACVLALLLAPIVRAMNRIGASRSAASGLVVVTATGLAATALFLVSQPAVEWFARIPEAMIRLRYTFSAVVGAIEDVKELSKDVARLSQSEGGQEVVVQGPDLAQMLLTNTGQLATMIIITAVLLFFLLSNGYLFLTKTVHILPTFSEKKRAVEVGRDLQVEVSRYLLTVTAINLGLGAVTAAAMAAFGLPDPLLWGVMAATLNFVPYVGAILTSGAILLAALLTFGTPLETLSAPLTFLVLTAVEGNLVTPSLVGRRLTLNPVIVFASLLFWGWIWGIAGLLLAVPLLVIFKILCSHIESLSVLEEYLSSAHPSREGASQTAQVDPET